MRIHSSSTPFSVHFDKTNQLDRSLPLSPFEFNAVCSSGIFDIPPHRHNHLELMIVESRSAVHRINGQEYPATQDTLFLIMPHRVHSLKNDKDSYVTALFVDFDMGFLLSRIKNKTLLRNAFEILNGSSPCLKCSEREYQEIREIMRSLVRSFDEHPGLPASPVDQYLITCLIEKALSLCVNERPVSKQWQIPAYLLQHFNEDITVKALAQSIGWSTSSLDRFFEKEFGQTCSKTLISIRMGFAGSFLLAYPSMTIKTIAEECGIPSESTFYRLFKDHYGLTPKEYRKQMLKRFFDKTDDSLPVVLNHELLLDVYMHHSERMTLKSFSQEKGLNAIQFKNDFDHCMGESFSRYVEDIRILHAKNVLSMTSLSIDKVGQLVGYPQTRSFNRAFLKKTGDTPAAYRKRFKALFKQSDNLPLK